MRIDWIRAFGLSVSLILASLFGFIIIRAKFVLLVPTQPIGQTVSFVLDTYRLLDLVALVFVLSASVAGCVALLMPKEK